MIFILDKQEKVINLLSNNGSNSSSNPFFNDLLVEDLATGAETFQFSTLAKGTLSKDLIVGNYIAFKKDKKYKLFQITQVEIDHVEHMEIFVYAECAGLSLLNNVIRKQTQNSVTLSRFLDMVTNDTDWSKGIVESLAQETFDLEIEDASCYSVLQNNIGKWNVEIEFRVEINNGRISKKYIDTFRNRGKVTGKRFTFNRDIESIKKTVDSSELYTALIGKGKNGIGFRDVTVAGIDKPLGQDYVADQASYEKYNKNGYHLTGIFEVDSESPQEVLRKTYEHLQKCKEPKISYEIPVVLLGDLLGNEWDKVRIGDYISIFDPEFSPELMLMARVSKLETSFTDPQLNKCTLTNFVELKSNITDAMKKMASKLEGYVDSQFPIAGDKIQDGAIGQEQMNQQYMSQISADIVKASKIEAEKIVADSIEAVNGRFENIEAEHGNFKEITTNKIEAIEGNFNEINADLGNFKEISTDKISAVEGKFDKVQADLVKTNTIVAGLGEFDLVVTDRINAVEGNFETINADYGNFKQVTTDKLTATEGRIEELDSDLITTKTIVGNLGKFDDVIAERVDAVEGTFVELEAEVGRINTLVSGNITSDNIHSSGISSDKLTIRDGFIKNAMIDTVNASKITAGEINTNKVHITSANGGIVIADNTQQFKDENGKVRIQMGQDASGNFNFGVFDATGSGTLIDATGVKEKALADGIIKDRMIGQGEIGGNKINISSMIDEVNKESNTKTIKGSKVQLDTEGQTLDVAFNSLKTNVDNIEFDGRNLLTRCSQYTSSSPLNLQTTRGDGHFETLGISTSVQLESGIYTLQCETNGTWRKTHNGTQDPTKKYCGLWLFRKTTTGTSTGHIFIDMTRKNPTVTISEKAIYYLRVNLYSDGVTNVSIDFWNIKLEKGDKKTGYSPAPEDIHSRIESNTTSISVQQGKINTLIQDTTIEKNGQSLKLKDEYSKLEQTVSGINSTVGSHTTSITNLDGKINTANNNITNLDGKIGTANNNISNLTGKVTEVESKQAEFKQDLDGFKQTVSNTYTTKTELSNTNKKVDGLTTTVEDVSGSLETTKTQVAGIVTDLDSITQRVSSTETSNSVLTEKVSSTVKNVQVYYAINTSSTSAPTSGWSLTPPQWAEGKYIWSKTTTTLTNGTSTTTNPVCITGAKGSTGAKGDKGDAGTTGTGIESITTEYYLSTSKTTQTGGSWVTTQPTWSTGKYLWTRSKIVYKNPTSTVYTTPICDSSWEAVNEIEIGGRNLIRKSKLLANESTVNTDRFTQSGEVTITTSTQFGGISFTIDDIKPNTKYVLSYRLQKTSGTLNVIAGHCDASWQVNKTYINGVEKGLYQHPAGVADTTDKYSVEVYFTTPATVTSTDRLYIQPNRNNTTSVGVKIEGLQLEEGNKSSNWTPAVEDVQANIDTKANSVDVYKKTETYTKSETDSKINIAKDSINLAVSNTYETKSNVETKISSANTSTLNSAKSYADTKKNEAISSASTDATNKVNSAKTELNNAINNIEIGGRNLLTNCAKYTASSPLNVQSALNDGYKQHPSICTPIELEVGTYVIQAETSGTWSSTHTTTGVDASKKYCSLWLVSTSNGNNIHQFIDMTRSVATVSISTKGVYYLRTNTYSNGTTNVSVNFWNIKLEKGNKKTGYSPAIEDVQTNIDKKANSSDVYTKSEVYTKSQTDSAINVAKDSINLGVSQTYETKSNVETKISSANTSTLNSAKSYADTKKTEAINSASTDATNKVNSAKTELNGKIDRIQVGGKNILRCSNFKNNNASYGWSNFSVKVVDGYLGEKAVNIDNSTATSGYIDRLSQIIHQNSDNKIMEASQWYTLSFYAKGSGTVRTHIYPSIIDSNVKGFVDNNERVLASDGHLEWNLTNEWVRHTYTFKTKASIPSVAQILLFRVLFASNVFICMPQLEMGTKVSAYTISPEDIQNDIDLKASKTDVYTKTETYTKSETDSKINIAKDSINLAVSNTYETKSNVTSKIATAKSQAITDSRSVQDTRNTNQNPSWYFTNYPKQTITEFKFANVIGIGTSNIYGTLETKVPWGDSTGGYPVQIFRSQSTGTYERKGTSNTTWSAWVEVESTTGSQAKANAVQTNLDTFKGNVYTKSEVYTKNETNSQITATTNAITSRVSSLESKEVANRKVTAFRYVRDSLRGSTANAGNHWVELQVWANGSNIAQGKTVTTNGTVYSDYPINRFTDGNTSYSQYAGVADSGSWKYLQVDLGEIHYNIDYLRVWHYYNDSRRYNHKLEVSVDGSTWYTIYDTEISGTYIETADGRVHIINETSTEKRLKTAENKITDSAIISTVSSTIQSAKNDAINSANTNTTNQLKNYVTSSTFTQTTNNITASFKSSGGNNLLRNSSFNNANGWFNYWGTQRHNNPTGYTEKIEYTAEWGFPDPEVSTSQIRVSNQSGIEYGLSQSLKTIPGKKYTISFYYASHRITLARVIVRGDNGSWLSNKEFNPSTYSGGKSSVGNWGMFEFTFTSNATSHTINIVVNTAGSDGYMWVAKPMVNEGDTAQAWTPHKEEIINGSTTIDGTGVTVKNGGLRVKDGSGNVMLEGDSSGILYLRNKLNIGNVGSFSQSGININSGSFRIVNNYTDVAISDRTTFNSTSINFEQRSTQNGYPPFSTTIKHDPEYAGINIVGGGGKGDNALYVNGYAVMLDGHSIYPSNIYASRLESRDTTYNSIQLRSHNNDMWFRSASEYFTFQCGTGGDNWTQSFGIRGVNSPAEGQNTNWIDFGQMKSNASNGSYRGVSIRKYANGGATAGDLIAGRYYLTGSENAYLTNYSNSGVKIQGAHGYVAIGPQNSSYCHYVTDRPTHWFDRNVGVQGEIRCGSGYNQLVPYGSMSNGYDNGTGEVCEGRIHIGGNKYIYYGWCSISCTAGASAERTYTVPNLSRIRGITIQCYTKGGTGNFGELALKQTYSNGFTFRLYNATNGGTHYITYMIIGE